MRYALAICAILCAAPAAADKAGATQLLVNNLVNLGGSSAQATVIARCFVDRMTDAQAAAFVAARNEDDRTAVIQAIGDKAGAQACVQQAMSG